MYLRHYLLLALAVAFGIALSAMARAVLEPWLGEGLLLWGVIAGLWAVPGIVGAVHREFRTPAPPATPPAALPPPLPPSAPAASDENAYPRSLRQMRRRYQTLYDEAFARQRRKS